MPDFFHYAVTASMLLPGGRRLPIPVSLSYSAEDCLAARMTFGLGGGPHDATWVFGWDLLASGLDGPAGLGDVRVAPTLGAPNLLQVRLSTPGAQACVDLDIADVRRFVVAVRASAAGDARLVGESLDAELSRIVERA